MVHPSHHSSTPRRSSFLQRRCQRRHPRTRSSFRLPAHTTDRPMRKAERSPSMRATRGPSVQLSVRAPPTHAATASGSLRNALRPPTNDNQRTSRNRNRLTKNSISAQLCRAPLHFQNPRGSTHPECVQFRTKIRELTPSDFAHSY
jgi:hypothetical protein